ncbi:MAG: hypothetical protein PHT16_02925 [Candidatus Pacebacteria bacterium]|nr:hypothetical protein [Candidatus Paceibacterota bacterium]
MKKILNWLSREDLNLKNKWWHRLLSIIFIFSFILFFIYNLIVYSNSNLFKGDIGVQEWKKVATISERITSEIKPISALIKMGEKIGDSNRTYVLNSPPDDYYMGTLNNVYCSTELANNYEKIKDNKNTDILYELFIMENNYRNKISSEAFSNYIKQNDIKCLIVDAYTSFNNTKVTFLQPDKSYQDNWFFYEKSVGKTIMYFLEMIPVVLVFSFLLFAGIIIFYYKIFLYIVFGSKKK